MGEPVVLEPVTFLPATLWHRRGRQTGTARQRVGQPEDRRAGWLCGLLQQHDRGPEFWPDRQRQNSALTCNWSATKMAPDMEILAIPVTIPKIEYAPKVLSIQ